MAIASTAVESVPTTPPETSRRGRWLTLAGIAGIAGVVGVLASAQINIPYYAIGPGNVVGTGALVEVADGPSFPAEGLAFPTVSLGQTTLLEALEGWLDPTIDVVEEKFILPPEVDAEELHDFNVRLMTSSKEKALAVAFERLGFDAVRGDGAEIVAVVEGLPAASELQAGDVIVAVNGREVKLDADAVAAIGEGRPGEELTVTYRRGDEQREAVLVPAEHPDVAGRPLLGVSLQTRNQRFDFPYDVEIASENIGGPSAGLAFTLQVLDELTEGRLTGDLRVAATGEIQLDGSVTEVGGVPQKAVAVSEGGIDLFLVPASEAEDARRHADDDVRIEPVKTLDDALTALARLGGDPLERA